MMIFEDSDDAPISKFLKRIFKDEVCFSNSNSNLRKFALQYAKTERYVFVFVDYVYDNARTHDVYIKLEKLERVFANIFVIKIPCIEYIALLTLKEMGILKSNEFTDKFIKSMECKVEYSEDSYEKFCKSVLNFYPLACVHNKSNKKGIKGLFWARSCGAVKECAYISEQVECTDTMFTLSSKAKHFINSLPCFYSDTIKSSKSSSSIDESEYRRVVKEINETFYGYITED